MNWIESITKNLPRGSIVQYPSVGDFDASTDDFGMNLPIDHLELLAWSNGGQIKFQSILFSFWSYSDIPLENKNYQIQQYLGKKIIAIGSDGGSICFLLDYREKMTPKFSSVNFGDLDVNEIKILAQSLSQALILMKNGAISSELL